MQKHKEIKIGKHFLSFGYDLSSFDIGFHVSRYSIDLNIFPLFIGFEFNGVKIEEYYSKIVNQIKEKK